MHAIITLHPAGRHIIWSGGKSDLNRPWVCSEGLIELGRRQGIGVLEPSMAVEFQPKEIPTGKIPATATNMMAGWSGVRNWRPQTMAAMDDAHVRVLLTLGLLGTTTRQQG
ncbi:hypothetical protein R6Q59_034974 [Mikania micrantha]